MNIDLLKLKNYIVLKYTPEESELLFSVFYPDRESFFHNNEEKEEKVRDIKKTFFVSKDLYETSLGELAKINFHDDEKDYTGSFPINYYFIIAELENKFFKFNKNILKTNFNLYLEENIDITPKYFYKYAGIDCSVFRPFNDFYKNQNLYILKEKRNEEIINEYIPIAKLEYLINNIPNQYEIRKYRESRYTQVLKEYLEVNDIQEQLNEYVDSKIKSEINNHTATDKTFLAYDKEKYLLYLNKLKDMLNDYKTYSENAWQKELLKIFKIINPKYIYVGEKLNLKSFFDSSVLITDIVLVDYNGNIDLMEIKKPTENIFYESKYRKNFVSIRELQGTCMQLQNYLLSLEKTEKGLLNKSSFKKKFIPAEIELNAILPNGYILFGLDKQLNENPKMKKDFQILRNMYSNIIDIITYDDLIRRFENVVNSYK